MVTVSHCFSVSEMNTKDTRLRFGYISLNDFHNEKAFIK